MPQSKPWSYKSTPKPSHPSAPSLVVSAGAPISPSKNALLASSSLEVKVRVHADGQEIDGEALQGGALIEEVRDWFSKNKASIGMDSVSESRAVMDGVSLSLNAFSRSARSSALSLPARPASASKTRTDTLESITLLLAFSSQANAVKPKRRGKQPAPDTHNSQPNLPSTPLVASLVSQLLHPTSLHFTCSTALTSALERVVKQLVVVFPLCFNPKWADRLTLDLPAYRSIASSLSNILNLGSNASDSSLPLEIDTAASLANLTLQTHLSALYPLPPTSSSTSALQIAIDPSLQSPSPPSSVDSKQSLELALLLVAKSSAPDAWVASAGGDGEGGRKGGGKGGKRGNKRVAKNAGVGGKGGAGSAKRRRSNEKAKQDDEADLAALASFANDAVSLESYGPRGVPRNGEEEEEEEEEEDDDYALDADGEGEAGATGSFDGESEEGTKEEGDGFDEGLLWLE